MTMVFVVVLAWVLSYSFWLMRKQLSKVDQMILWFLNTMLLESAHTILSLNLNWIHYNQDIAVNLSFLILRSFIYPMLLIICENAALATSSMLLRIGTRLGTLLAFLLIEWWAVQAQIISFITFNYVYSALLYAGFLVFSYLVVQLLRLGGIHERRRI